MLRCQSVWIEDKNHKNNINGSQKERLSWQSSSLHACIKWEIRVSLSSSVHCASLKPISMRHFSSINARFVSVCFLRCSSRDNFMVFVIFGSANCQKATLLHSKKYNVFFYLYLSNSNKFIFHAWHTSTTLSVPCYIFNFFFEATL